MAAIGVVLVSHGKLAQEMLHTANLLAGEGGGAALGLLSDEAPEAFARRVAKVLRTFPSAAGLLVLADLPGGTPYQCAVQACHAVAPAQPVAVVAPMNVAMTIEALLGREGESFPVLLAVVERAGSSPRTWRPDGCENDD